VLRDYQRWLGSYDDPASGLSWRLRQVQEWLRADLVRRPGAATVVSVCAGDGRDILEVLGEGDDRVRVTLLEAHPVIAEMARSRARSAGLTNVDVRTCDAATTDNYLDVVPADVVLLVGVLGNISEQDLWRTIAAAPQLCAPEATLIWSRGRDRDDLNDRLRGEFLRSGFLELDYAESVS
jgi:hypothetical protein